MAEAFGDECRTVRLSPDHDRGSGRIPGPAGRRQNRPRGRPRRPWHAGRHADTGRPAQELRRPVVAIRASGQELQEKRPRARSERLPILSGTRSASSEGLQPTSQSYGPFSSAPARSRTRWRPSNPGSKRSKSLRKTPHSRCVSRRRPARQQDHRRRDRRDLPSRGAPKFLLGDASRRRPLRSTPATKPRRFSAVSSTRSRPSGGQARHHQRQPSHHRQKRTVRGQGGGLLSTALSRSATRSRNVVAGAAHITKPETEEEAEPSVHRGAAAVINGTERTFLDKYSDYFGLALLLLSGIGSAAAPAGYAT